MTEEIKTDEVASVNETPAAEEPREDIELYLILGDLEDEVDSPLMSWFKRLFGKVPSGAVVYQAEKPNMGTLKRWMRMTQEMQIDGKSFDDPDQLTKLFEMVADIIGHPEVTGEVIENGVILENFLAMFNQSRITGWINQQTTVPQKKVREIEQIARMRVKKRRRMK